MATTKCTGIRYVASLSLLAHLIIHQVKCDHINKKTSQNLLCTQWHRPLKGPPNCHSEHAMMNLKKKLVERRLNTVTKLMTTMRTLSYYVELLIGPIKCGFRQWVECSLALKTWKVQEKKWSFIGVTSFSHTFDFVLMYKRF